MQAKALKKKTRVIWLCKLILATGLLYLALRWFEYKQTYQPSRNLVSSTKDASSGALDLTIPSGKKHQINAWLIPNSNEAVYGDWLIIFSHGNAGNITHRQDLYQTWLALGFNLLAYDYRGYGKSTGTPSESGSYEDLRSVLNWALENGWNKDRILLLGKSLGGGVGSEIAKENQVAGLLLHSTFTSIPDVGAELFPFLPVRIISAIRHDTASKLPHIKIPVLILHSPADTLIRFHHAEMNFKAANEPKMLREITGDHNDSEWERRASLKIAVDAFMQSVLSSSIQNGTAE
ncbi:alpha/beta hydrolase [bacterium]|nr:alpha/beta hydrolase [bacterium]